MQKEPQLDKGKVFKSVTLMTSKMKLDGQIKAKKIGNKNMYRY